VLALALGLYAELFICGSEKVLIRLDKAG
jgi:hypothetical protein